MKLILKSAILSSFLALAMTSVASAQSMRVSVPFHFNACGKSFPAGAYKVTLVQSARRVELSQVEGNDGCVLPIKAFTTTNGTRESGGLVLNGYGSSYFLAGVRTGGMSEVGADLFTSTAEREFAKVQTAAKPIVLLASGR